MRFIRGHSLVHLLSLVGVSSYCLHKYLVLVSAALLRVGQWGGYSSHILTPALWCVWHLPIFFLSLQDVFQTPWSFSANMRTLFHYWGFPLSILFVRYFLEAVTKLSENFLSLEISVRAAEFSALPIISMVSNHVSGFMIFNRSAGGVLVGIFVPMFCIFLGVLWSSQKDCSATADNVRGSLLPVFYFTLLMMEKVLMGRFPHISRDFYCSHLSSCSVRNRG